jgi:hypothetical protein
VDLFLENPLVASQFKSLASAACDVEPSKAKDIPIKTIIGMERLVLTAPTPQLRCYCGLFALLGSTSLRAADAIRSRALKISGDAVTAVSKMKNKKSWTRWYAPRIGFSGVDWASEWIEQLWSVGLPGDDFLLLGVNSAGDVWSDVPATYGDVRRMLHLVLMSQFNLRAVDAVEFNPHGFRHVLITAAHQLKGFGVVSEPDLDVLGHWSKGSAMPRSYDSSAGVTEMRTREAIIQQIRLGWRLVNDGSFPMAPIGNVDADNPRILVTNTRSRKVHATKRGMKRSLCGFFTCGSPEEPGSGADFVNTSGSMCKQCN